MQFLEGQAVRGPVSARATIGAKDYVNFLGSGYLALAQIPEVRAAAQRALDDGAAFARQIPASLGLRDPIFEGVERQAADALGCKSSVYFASGYLIGAVGLSALVDDFDAVVLDSLAHQNLVDASRLSQRPILIFPHGDPEGMRRTLHCSLKSGQRPLLVSDGVFPTSGRIPPLDDYAQILAEYDGAMFIDESHGFGVVGACGRGAAEHCGVAAAIGSTLSKAFCAQGAVFGRNKDDETQFRSKAPLRGANSGSPISAAVAAASLAYVAAHPELRDSLRSTANYLRERLRSLGLECIDTPAPIVSFVYETASDMRRLQSHLFEQQIVIHYSTYSDAGDQGMIRCAVFRDHSRDDVDMLISALKSAC